MQQWGEDAQLAYQYWAIALTVELNPDSLKWSIYPQTSNLSIIANSMTFQQLQKQVLDLPPGDRWALLKVLVESLQPTPPPVPQATPTLGTLPGNEDNSLAQYYGCIDDETFIRHPQPEQGDRQPIL